MGSRLSGAKKQWRGARGVYGSGHKVAAESLLDNRLSPHNGKKSSGFNFRGEVLLTKKLYNLLTILNDKKIENAP